MPQGLTLAHRLLRIVSHSNCNAKLHVFSGQDPSSTRRADSALRYGTTLALSSCVRRDASLRMPCRRALRHWHELCSVLLRHKAKKEPNIWHDACTDLKQL